MEKLVYYLTIDGREYFLHEGDRLFRNNKNYIFIGEVDDEKTIPPHMHCVYVFGEKVKFQTPKPQPIPKMKISESKQPYTNDKKLNIPISHEDGELMVIVKSLERLQNITLSEFKELFDGDSTVSNNFKYSLENKHDISWKRAREIMSRLNYGYRLDIIDLEK